MGDNTPSGSDSIATDELTTLNGAASSGVKVQRVKVGFGDDGTHRDASSLFPFPVNIAASAGGASQTTQALTAAAASTLAGATSTTASYVLDVSSAGNASFAIAAATSFVGTIAFEQSFDAAGANGSWAPVPCIPEDVTTPPLSTAVLNVGALYVRQFSAGMLGPKLFRVRCSAYTSGTLTVVGVAGPGWYEGNPALAPSNAVIGAVSRASATTYSVTTVNTNATANTNSVSLAADTTRKALIIWNRGTVPLTVGFGTATSATVYSVIIPAGQGYEVPPEFAPSAINTQASVVSSPVQFSTAV